MSKQRFYITDTGLGLDTVSDEIYNFGNEEDFCRLFDKLNEQQSTIEQKDKQLGRLYNYFQDYLKDEMSGNAFSEMWDFVKEDEKWEDEWQE